MAFADLDSFILDKDGDPAWVQEAEDRKRSAATLEQDGKRPNLGDLAPVERPEEFDISDYRNPKFLEFLFGDPGAVETPPPIDPQAAPKAKARKAKARKAPTAHMAPEADHQVVCSVAEHAWKERANQWLDIEGFADHHLFPWASVKPHLGSVTPEVRDAVMADGFETWATVTHGLPRLLVPTAIGTVLLKYRGYRYRLSRDKSRKSEIRPVSQKLTLLLGEVKDGILHPGHIDMMFGKTGVETASRFHSFDPRTITVCKCGCLRAPDIAHDCRNREANLMTNDVLLGCAAHQDLSIANLHKGTDVGLKINTADLGNCDCPSSASLPLFFIFGGKDPVVYPNSNYDVGGELLGDITAEGSRHYEQAGITTIERQFTFFQYPVDVTRASANFGPFTYNKSLEQVDYPTVIAQWNSKSGPAKARVKRAKAPREPLAAAPQWGFDELFDDAPVETVAVPDYATAHV